MSDFTDMQYTKYKHEIKDNTVNSSDNKDKNLIKVKIFKYTMYSMIQICFDVDFIKYYNYIR